MCKGVISVWLHVCAFERVYSGTCGYELGEVMNTSVISSTAAVVCCFSRIDGVFAVHGSGAKSMYVKVYKNVHV